MEKCKECRFCNCSPLPETYGRGSKNARIMFIQDFVTDAENKRGIQFWGKSCDELRRHMKELEIDVDDIYWTSVIKCPMPDEFYKPTIKDSGICVDSLMSEIEIVDPDIIVPTGSLSLKYTLNRVDITKVRGNAQEAEICGRKRIVIPIMHPRQSLKKPIYKDLTKKDLKTLADTIDNGMNEVTGVDYRSLETIDEVLEECERLSKADWISFDLETTGLSPFQDDSAIVCISLTDKPYYGVCIPLYHPETPFTTPELGTIVKALRKLLQNPNIKKVAQNGKFDIKWLHSWLGILVANFCFDTMLAHYIAVSEESGTQGLKSMAWEYTDMGGYDNELDEYKSTLPPAMRNNYGNIPWNILSRYAVADVDCCIRLKDIFLPMIEENPKWKVLFSDILMPASYALMTLEEDGMLMNANLIDKYEKSYSDEISRIQSRLQSYPEVLQIERERQEKYREREAIALIKKADRTAEEQRKFEDYKKYKDPSFSWSSSAQLKELLFDRLKLTTTVRTAKGELSTSEDALIEMSEQHELPALMMELRKVQTLYSMFIKKLPDMRDKTGRVHPVYNLSGTVTGRLASENPNAQQMPRKAEVPSLFQYQNEPKALFCSRFGDEGCIANLDYSQLELRVAGIISQDSILEEVYKSGVDLHIATASKTFGVPIEEVTKDLRTKAKGVGFGIIYGKSGVTFGKELYLADLYKEAGDPKGDGKSLPEKLQRSIQKQASELGFKIVDDYLAAYPELSDWLGNTKMFAMKNGYVETMFGRRRRLPDLKSTVPTLKENAMRQSINAPIQGTGSDFTLRSIIEIQQYLKDNNMKSKMICTVHDSIVFDIYIPELSTVVPKFKDIMEHVHEKYIDTEVPILSEIEMGENYGGVFEVDVDTVKSIKTVSDFKRWIHEQKIGKYKKEITYFHDKADMSVENLLKWMKSNKRPIKELASYIEEIYSKEDE